MAALHALRRRLGAFVSGPAAPVPDGYTIKLNHPPAAADEPRWGHGRPPHAQISALLAAGHDRFAETISAIERRAGDLGAIPRARTNAAEPCWTLPDNPWFKGLDGASLYTFLRDREAQTYLEIGSGESTRFAARARSDGALATRIVSIDPHPRREIDALCDEVVRAPLETVAAERFAALRAGDVVLFDGSHRLFMNSDVAAFFCDMLPLIAPGVLVGVHDIPLPEDYPPSWGWRYYSEVYMLATTLLAAGPRLRVVLPNHYVCIEPALRERWHAAWSTIGLDGVNPYGSAFWFEAGADLWAGSQDDRSRPSHSAN